MIKLHSENEDNSSNKVILIGDINASPNGMQLYEWKTACEQLSFTLLDQRKFLPIGQLSSCLKDL